MGRSEELFERAVKRIPGGVNSPVRAYGAIGMAPRFIKRADGCHIYDVDGNEYVDYIDSWGPMILGHNFPQIREAVVEACADGLSFGCATEIEVEMAEFICEHLPHVEMVRMVNSGTEAVNRTKQQLHAPNAGRAIWSSAAPVMAKRFTPVIATRSVNLPLTSNP